MNIKNEKYPILLEDFREDASVMCNLSMGIRESAAKAATEAATIKFVMSMHSKGYTTAQIADVAGMEEKQIEEIIKNSELLPA